MRLAAYVLVGLIAFVAVGCSKQDAEARAREAAAKIKASIPNVEEHAREQKVSPEEVKTVQAQLTKLNEYQGEINGKLDSVTVNAIEAFQREKDLKANGMLTEETRRLLQESAGTGASS